MQRGKDPAWAAPVKPLQGTGSGLKPHFDDEIDVTVVFQSPGEVKKKIEKCENGSEWNNGTSSSLSKRASVAAQVAVNG